ncbi:LGFP repeat-containing protein [Geodermatophilus sp. SYSU D01105]
MRLRLRLATASLFVLGLAFVFAVGSSPQQPDLTESANLGLFDPGNIISDGVFYNSSTMSTAEVQSFLQTKGSGCSGSYCLKSYRQDTWTRAKDSFCAGYQGVAGETAAKILSKVARSCGVNPQALLVILQKEQSLVTATAPTSARLRSAMGYGCPDTAPCDAQYYGFYNQVFSAAHRFKEYRANPSRWNHRAGVTVNVRYHPNAACGTLPVYIQNQATAGLYNYTPYTPNKAALAAGYGEGDACSAYGNRNFFQYFVDWFGSTQSSGGAAIVEKYDSLKASGVDLAGATSEVTCTLPYGGCWQAYQGGTIFWHRDSGAHVVRGAILEHYLKLGGPSNIGYPVGDDTAAPWNSGWYTDFQGGSIYWSTSTGAHDVRGAIRDKWRSWGAQAGALGYPTGNDTRLSGGYRSDFQGGSVYWSSSTGAHVIRGAIRDTYLRVGAERSLGFPSSDDGPTRAGDGAYSTFSGGAIYWSPSTGARVLRAGILQRWRELGAETGALGYPIANQGATPGASGTYARFEGGSIYWSQATGTRVLKGAILDRYVAHGGPEVLGFPMADDAAVTGGGRAVRLQGGAIYWSTKTGAQVVRGAILERYLAAGAQAGEFGFPTASYANTPGVVEGKTTQFQGGTFFWSKDTGARVLRGAILERYQRFGGSRVLGLPTTDDVPAARGGARASLQGGVIYWSSSTGAHVVRGAVLQRWRAWGGAGGELGYPTASYSNTPGVAGGKTGQFEGGSVFWSEDTGARVLRGAILERYLSHGGSEVLGLPTTDDVPAARGGARASLQGGVIYWSSSTGAHVVRGAVLQRWRALGGAGGELGYPTASYSNTPGVVGGKANQFSGGSIFWSRDTGARVLRGAVLERYVAAGGPRVLGFPTTDDVAAGSGRKVTLTGGAIYWSQATGAQVVLGAAATEYARLGAEASYLGFPVSSTTVSGNEARTEFQGGYILVDQEGRPTAHRNS